ncbi:uncharacterized [Tachysurus ichikawai]
MCADRASALCGETATGRNKLERDGDRNHSDRVETWQRVRKRIGGGWGEGRGDRVRQSRLWTRPHLPLQQGREEGEARRRITRRVTR